MNLTSIEVSILNFLINEGEVKRSVLHRHVSNKQGEIPLAISRLKKAGYMAFAKISTPGNGRDPELLKVTNKGLLAWRKNEEEAKKIKWETIRE